MREYKTAKLFKIVKNMQRRKIGWILEEIAFLIALALPASIECFTEGLQIQLSNIFIGRASVNNIALILNALFIGQSAIFLISYPIAEGFGVYVNILCSQAYGAKQYKVAGLYFYRALFMAALTCFPVFTIFISARPIVYILFQDWELAQYVGSFTDVLCFGYPAYLYYKIGFRFLQALNIVWGPVLYLIIGNILNGVIQYILIFKYNTSIEGAAAGYVISNYLVALLVFAHIQLSHVHSAIAQEWSVEHVSGWIHTAQYAIVPFFQGLISTIPLTVFPIIFIGLMAHDKQELAIYSIVYSIWWVFNLGTIGFACAATVRVGNLLGANQPKMARNASILYIIFGQLILILCNILLLVTSEPISYLFTTDPTFAKKLTWNIRLFSFLLNSDIRQIVQGVMNACCKQGIQMALKLVFQTIIGTVTAAVLAQFVKWRALSVFMSLTVASFISSIIATFILFCSKWENVAISVSKNTKRNSNSKERAQVNQELSVLKESNIPPKVSVLVKYLSLLATGIAIFAATVIRS